MKDIYELSSEKAVLCAEIGINHNGDLDTARTLIAAAAASGFDAVKFQAFQARSMYSRYHPGFAHTKVDVIGQMERLEVKPSWWPLLRNEARNQGLSFGASVFSEEARLDLLDFGLDFVKVASAELNNVHFVQSQQQLSDVFVISTGMAYLAEIAALVESLRRSGTKKIILLECTTAYPTPPGDIRLRNISYLHRTFKLPTGFSDHSRGTHMLLAAAALGARFLEKHFTLDREQAGPDHSLSADPEEMKRAIAAIREIEQALRQEGKESLSLTEEEERLNGRKSVHASRDIVTGEVFTPDNTLLKRPGTGIPPFELPLLLGRRAKNSIPADTCLNWSQVE